MTRILKTKEYDMFIKHENNRAIDPGNLKKISFSIQSNNLLEFRPILVDSDMCVIDGQHRLEAAKSLGVDIYYQISDSSKCEDIILLNANQKNWTAEDYVNYWTNKGNLNYKKLKEFSENNKIPLAQVLKYLITASGIDRSKTLKTGLFIFPNEEKIEEINKYLGNLETILKVLQRYLITNKKLASSRNLRLSLMAILKNPNLNIDTLIDKISYKAESIRSCTTVQAYYCLFRDIYNWRNSNPIE